MGTGSLHTLKQIAAIASHHLYTAFPLYPSRTQETNFKKTKKKKTVCSKPALLLSIIMSFAENRQPFQSAISIQNAIKIEAVKLSGAVGANLAVTHIKIPFR